MKYIIELTWVDGRHAGYVAGYSNTYACPNVTRNASVASTFDGKHTAEVWSARYLPSHRWRVVPLRIASWEYLMPNKFTGEQELTQDIGEARAIAS